MAIQCIFDFDKSRRQIFFSIEGVIMMYKTRIVILFVFISCCGLHAYGQNFFWSDREFGQGA